MKRIVVAFMIIYALFLGGCTSIIGSSIYQVTVLASTGHVIEYHLLMNAITLLCRSATVYMVLPLYNWCFCSA